MLCGVGGRTIEEAQRNISHAEFVRWCQFRNRWGSLHIGMRIDRAVASAVRTYLNANSRGERFKWPAFSPYDEAAQKVDVDSPDSMIKFLRAKARG